jgi:hypothetical protein
MPGVTLNEMKCLQEFEHTHFFSRIPGACYELPRKGGFAEIDSYGVDRVIGSGALAAAPCHRKYPGIRPVLTEPAARASPELPSPR